MLKGKLALITGYTTSWSIAGNKELWLSGSNELIGTLCTPTFSGVCYVDPLIFPYSQEKLSVPDNLYIIGTMNTTDKSISLLDVALRRRFKFISVEPNYKILKDIDNLSISKMLEVMNKRLAILKGEDFQIGHSYFLNASNIEDLQEIFEFKIIPLLKEYFHGDWESICAVLNQDYQSIKDSGLLINKFTDNKNLFKNNQKFSDKVKKRKNCKLNSNFSIDDLKTVI